VSKKRLIACTWLKWPLAHASGLARESKGRAPGMKRRSEPLLAGALVSTHLEVKPQIGHVIQRRSRQPIG